MRSTALLCRTLLAAALAAAASPAGAELRVLLAFDEAGHRVHRVTRSASDEADLRGHVAPSVDPDVVALAGDASLAWLDADGRTLSTERVSDPRVGHAPAPGGNAVAISPGAPVALAEGAWLAQGPSAATSVVLRLPARSSPPLPPEEWRLALDEP